MKVPFFKTLRFRLISSIVIIEIVMLSILVLSNLNAIYLAHTERLNDTAASILRQFSRTAATYMAEVDYAELDEYARRVIEKNEISYIRVITSENNEVVRLGKNVPKNSPSLDKHPSLVDDERFDVKTDIVLAGRNLGQIEMGFSLHVMRDAVNSSRNRSILIALTEILLSIAVTIFIGIRLTNNLHNLSEAAALIGEGKLGVTLPVKGNDEIGQTSIAFNNMVEQLYKYRYQMEELIADRTSELEEANKELETFSYSVSHDLRAPLKAISNFTHLLEDDYSNLLDEDAKDYLSRIDDTASKMEVLINDILQLAQVKRKELELETVDLSLISEEILDRYTYTEPNRKVSIQIEKGIECECDRGLMIVVMENLLGNAWKYSSKKENAIIEFGFNVEKGKKVFFVKDNGAGFDMQHAEAVFTAFKRLHGESDFTGTGVGLATVNRVIQRHRGNIWVESKVGEGTTFYFNFSEESA